MSTVRVAVAGTREESENRLERMPANYESPCHPPLQRTLCTKRQRTDTPCNTRGRQREHCFCFRGSGRSARVSSPQVFAQTQASAENAVCVCADGEREVEHERSPAAARKHRSLRRTLTRAAEASAAATAPAPSALDPRCSSSGGELPATPTPASPLAVLFSSPTPPPRTET